MKKDYLARTDGDFDTWEEEFLTQLAIVAAVVGITPPQVTDLTTIIGDHRTLFATAVTKKNEAHAATNAARNKRKAVSAAVRPLVRQIKASPGYTTEIGENLDIIGEEEIIDWNTAKPELKVKLDGGTIVLSFKKGQSDGIKLYSKQGNQTDFTFLATDTESPYVDNRPKLSSVSIPTPGEPSTAVENVPETREYEAYYMLGDEQVGQLSDTIKITLP